MANAEISPSFEEVLKIPSCLTDKGKIQTTKSKLSKDVKITLNGTLVSPPQGWNRTALEVEAYQQWSKLAVAFNKTLKLTQKQYEANRTNKQDRHTPEAREVQNERKRRKTADKSHFVFWLVYFTGYDQHRPSEDKTFVRFGGSRETATQQGQWHNSRAN